MKLKAILFDHDGTLVDSEVVHWGIWQQVLAPFGVSMDEATYRQHHSGVPTPENARKLVAEHRIDMSAAALADLKEIATAEHLARTAFPLIPGAREAVRQFHAAGLVLAVVTGGGRSAALSSLRAYGMEDCFSTIISCESVERGKPAPDCYLLAMKQLGLQAEECIAIEDTQHGLEAAHGAGVACYCIPNAMSANHDFSLASACFENIRAAHAWISATHGLS